MNRALSVSLSLSLVASSIALSACSGRGAASVTPGEVQCDLGAPRAAVSDYNLEEGLALQGYDPVSYFAEGGGVPTLGGSAHTLRYDGVVYRFVSEANRELFVESPGAYEPSYGGWCAWAMARGASKVKPDPTNFTIENGRLRLFYRNAVSDTRAKWLSGDVGRLGDDADENWRDLTGETVAAPAA